MALIPVYQGKFKEALEVMDNGIAADRMEQAEGTLSIKQASKSIVYREIDLNLALKEVEKCLETIHSFDPDDKFSWQHYYVLVLAENKDFEKAEQVTEALKKNIEQKDNTAMWMCWYATGCIEFSKGNLKKSVANFEKLVEADPDFPNWFLLAKAYLASGRLGEAVTEFEKILSRYDDSRAFNTIRAVKAYYLLGLAYEKSGWNKKAIDKYEEFLDIWKDADPGIPEVEDAKERLKKLRVES
jgi:tetratricopeptide (TPR) repeat protein